MSDQLPSPEPDDVPKGGWRRPLSYLLLIAGAAGIIFNNQLSQNTGISSLVFQVITFALFIAGAGLFFSVRETTDRVSTYRKVFSASDNPSKLSPEESNSTESDDKQSPY